MPPKTEQQTYDELCNRYRETALLEGVNALLGWDERTMLPKSAGPHRAEQMGLLAGVIHRRKTHPSIGEQLDFLAESQLAADVTSDSGATLVELRRDYEKQRKLPQDLVEALTRATVIGQQVWVEARGADDFSTFAPQLQEIIRLSREKAESIGYEDCRYDVLLDDYEPRASTRGVAQVLSELGHQLGPLVREIVESGRASPRESLQREYAVDAQRRFGVAAAKKIGFNFDAGRLDEAHHPFCTTLGPRDCRITTRYNSSFFPSAFFGTLHEAGHGIYEQGLREDFYGLPPGQAASLGIHESQSRLWENFVGRSRAFWEYFYPLAVKQFPDALSDVSLDDFYWAINDVRPSLIRVEADEATYNLHIVIRFELERLLIDEDLPVADLPDAWNERYEHYLGIQPPSAADGVLQDIHWSAGLFGYFATYTLGNLYAAQLFEQASSDLGNLDGEFAKGEFGGLLNWLRTRLHEKGRCLPATDLVASVCGTTLESGPLMSYLKSKLTPLYGLA